MLNNFDTDVALEVGINAAILYKNIQFWCEYNRTNEKNFYDGYYWTYNSAKAFSEQFPYFTEKQIRTSLSILEKRGYIKTGNYNKLGGDRTKWYTDLKTNAKASDTEGSSILPGGQMELTCGANGTDLEGRAIPNNNSDNNSDNNSTPLISPQIASEQEEFDFMFKMFWKAYPRKVNSKGCKKKFIKIENLKKIFPDIMQALEAQKQSKQWTKDNGRFIPYPSTWINQERWNDVNEVAEKQAEIDEIVAANIDDFLS